MGRKVLEVEVSFVGDEHSGDSIVGVAAGLVQPLGDVGKGLFAGDVVDKDDADGTPIVRSSDGLKCLLAGLCYP